MSEVFPVSAQLNLEMLSFAWPHQVDLITYAPSFDWDDTFGSDGEFLINSCRRYSYERHHRFLVKNSTGDYLMGTAHTLLPLLMRWGDVVSVEEIIDMQIANIHRSLEEPNQVHEQISSFTTALTLTLMMHSTGISHGRDQVTALFVEQGLTYQDAEATTHADLKIGWVRQRGDDTRDLHHMTFEHYVWLIKLAHVLISTNSGTTAQDVLADLPTVAEMIPMVVCTDCWCGLHACNGPYYNLLWTAALACEKFGDCERALGYIDAALSSDLSQAGTMLPISRVVFSLTRGRILASLERLADATSVFETAAEEAHQRGMWGLEAFALRDLYALDKTGHGARRLGAALRQLKGPASKLTPLMQGLDAAELIALPPPDTEQ